MLDTELVEPLVVLDIELAEPLVVLDIELVEVKAPVEPLVVLGIELVEPLVVLDIELVVGLFGERRCTVDIERNWVVHKRVLILYEPFRLLERPYHLHGSSTSTRERLWPQMI